MKFITATLIALASQASATTDLTCATAGCGQPKTIAFEEFSRGTYLAMDTYATCGISSLSCHDKNDSDPARKCRIFDTEEAYGSWSVDGSDPICEASSCSIEGGCDGMFDGETKKNRCGDPDLVAPFVDVSDLSGPKKSPGKVIIYDEVWGRINEGFEDEHGADTYPPDDDMKGAQMVFEFAGPVTISEIAFLDIEEDRTFVEFYYADGSDETKEYIDSVDDAQMRTVKFNEDNGKVKENVMKILVKIMGSGAITSLTFTEECTKPGGGGGDPHLQLWGREKYSFHGECDLVMVHSEQFHNKGLDLHIRTTIQDYFSYIERAALRVGSNILEVQNGSVLLDGVEHVSKDLPLVFGDDENKYTLSEVDLGKKNCNVYQLDLVESSVVFKFYKQFLTISIDGHAVDFGDSVGLLGDYGSGEKIGRRGQVIRDNIEFGFEWQVAADEPVLFQQARSPQMPYEKCRMPTIARPERRRLRGANSALFEDAKKACSAQTGNDFDLCIEDVMATGDVGLATVW